MKHLKILNTREKKEILEFIDEQWGAGADFKKRLRDIVFLLSTKDKLYLISRDFELVDDKKLNIDSAGLYFGELQKDKKDKIRLSIEGSQLVGPSAKKNVVELDEDEIAEWLRGNDIEKDCRGCSGFVMLKTISDTKDFDFLGCGYCKDKEKILNYLPKARRINALNI